MRTIVIGDLHGCHAEAVRLLDKCQVTPNDWVIFVGDFVDRGPENAKCCDLVRHREQVQGRPAGVLGNHEEKHIHYEDVLARGGRLADQLPPTHVETRAQLKREHYDWFRSLPLFIRVPEHNSVVVHAGVFPGRTIEKQSPRHLLHIQSINPYQVVDGKVQVNEKSMWPSRVPAEERERWGFWHQYWDGQERIIFGHSVLNKPLVREKAVGVDGGACFGRELWAFIMPDNVVVSVTADKPSASRDRGLYPIDGDVATFS